MRFSRIVIDIFHNDACHLHHRLLTIEIAGKANHKLLQALLFSVDRMDIPAEEEALKPTYACDREHHFMWRKVFLSSHVTDKLAAGAQLIGALFRRPDMDGKAQQESQTHCRRRELPHVPSTSLSGSYRSGCNSHSSFPDDMSHPRRLNSRNRG